MRVSFLRHERTNEIAGERELTWPGLVEVLRRPRECSCTLETCGGKSCSEKSGPAWIPASFRAPVRRKDNVRDVHALVLDLDDLDAPALQGVLAAAESYSYILHGTHAHPTSDAFRLRLILELEASVPASAWPAFVERAFGVFGRVMDESCRDPGRLYFLPSVPKGAEYEFVVHPGVPYPVGTTVASATPEPVGLDIEWIRASLRAQAKQDPTRAAEFLAVAESRPLASPGGRDNALYNVCVAISRAERPGGGPPPTHEEVEAVLAFSLATMDTAPEGPDYWAKAALAKYDHSLRFRNERDTATEFAQAVLEEKRAERGDLPAEAFVQGKDSKPAAVGRNVETVLRRDHRWQGKVRWNEMLTDIDLAGTPAEGSATADTALMNWLQATYDLRLKQHEVAQQLLLVARANPFNPVKELLERYKWDGVDRAENFFFHYFGATTHLLGGHTAGFLAALGKRWLISAVARVYRPGLQVDTTLILEGEQGIGKSSALRILAGDEWYSGSKFQVGDKDARMVLTRKWIVEIQELASMRKTDIESLRAFLTETHDTFRVPYGRKIESFPRRSIFVGTTNDFEEYLNDPAGNRRYWPVRCTEVDLAALAADREQIWAQAVTMFKAGEQHWLTPAEEHLMQTEREVREAPTNSAEIAVSEAMARRLLLMAPDKRPKVLAADQAAVDLLDMKPGEVHPAVAKKIDNAFALMGAEPARLFGVPGPGRSGRILAHSRRKVWRIPQWLLEAPQGSRLEEVREEDRTTERESG